MLNVAILVPGLKRGGAERIAIELASRLASEGQAIQLISVFNEIPVFDYSPALVIGCLRSRQLFNFKGAGVIENLLTLYAIRRYVKEHRITRLMVFTNRLASLAYLAIRGLKNVELYCGEVSNPLIARHGTLWHTFTRYCYPRFDCVILQTHTIAKALHEWDLGDYQVIANSTLLTNHLNEQKPVQGSNREPCRFIFVGRLTEEKGLQDTLLALKALPEEIEWSFDIYGDGEYRAALEALISTLTLSHQVIMHGQISDVQQVLALGGVFVMSSYREGFPVALLEAQAMGLMAISYRTPFGPEDIIEHKKTGLLVEFKNIPLLTSALETAALMSEQQRSQLGESAARRAHQLFHRDKIYQQWKKTLMNENTSP